jgi:hypothetical protein
MDGYLTRKTVQKVKEVLESPGRRDAMINRNFAIAKKYYSFDVLHRWLTVILTNFFGTEV